MNTHNTMPAMAQKYHRPMWQLPTAQLNHEDTSTEGGNRRIYQATRASYVSFAHDMLNRIGSLE